MSNKNSAREVQMNVTSNKVVVNDIETTITTKRAKHELDRAIKREMGLLKKGRPVDPTSPRQKHLNELNEKREMGLLHPGRPKYTEEQRVITEAEKKQRSEFEAKQIAAIAKKLVAQGMAEETLKQIESNLK